MTAQEGPKTAHDGPKMIHERPEMPQQVSEMAPREPNGGPRGFEIVPKLPEEAGHTMAPRVSPSTDPQGPKTAQRWPRTLP